MPRVGVGEGSQSPRSRPQSSMPPSREISMCSLRELELKAVQAQAQPISMAPFIQLCSAIPSIFGVSEILR